MLHAWAPFASSTVEPVKAVKVLIVCMVESTQEAGLGAERRGSLTCLNVRVGPCGRVGSMAHGPTPGQQHVCWLCITGLQQLLALPKPRQLDSVWRGKSEIGVTVNHTTDDAEQSSSLSYHQNQRGLQNSSSTKAQLSEGRTHSCGCSSGSRASAACGLCGDSAGALT